MRFVSKPEIRSRFEGRSVAIVGSGPGCAQNPPGLVDGHDVVVRVNNYRLSAGAGKRTDVFYSFFGNSIKKSVVELKRDGVQLCMCKCHERKGRSFGVDFRWIYQKRARWWFCDTHVPTLAEFRASLALLGGHVPTTGFSAILEILSLAPAAVYLTGFDGFRSGLHNVTERWRPGDPADPVRHEPERELAWLAANIANHPITTDRALGQALATIRRTAA